MKKQLVLASVAVMIFAASAVAQNHATKIKIQAMDMARGFIDNDFNRFVQYMHPDIIAFAGGKEAMKSKMDTGYLRMKTFGVKVKKYHIGNPGTIIQHKGALQTLLPQTTVLETPMGDLTAETTMIVISKDKGKTWWFIDTNVYRAEKLKSILPDLSPKLVVPPQKKPKLEQPKD